MKQHWHQATIAALSLLVWPACDGGLPQEVDADSQVVLVGAGDIADCASSGAEATATLLDNIEGIVFTAGDNVSSSGEAFANCYDPTWGRHRDRTRPAIGNHEYDTGTADSYHDYFGEAAGPRGKAYYSYDLGDWHIVVLNTEFDYEPGGEQEAWLIDDLASSNKQCTLAYSHKPRHYQGTWGMSIRSKEFWEVLYAAGADVVVSAHHHLYERYARLTPDGDLDPTNGIRQFIVGTGGHGHDALLEPHPYVEVRDNTTFGVIKLTLRPGEYDWEFVPEAGGTFTDSGTEACH